MYAGAYRRCAGQLRRRRWHSRRPSRKWPNARSEPRPAGTNPLAPGRSRAGRARQPRRRRCRTTRLRCRQPKTAAEAASRIGRRGDAACTCRPSPKPPRRRHSTRAPTWTCCRRSSRRRLPPASGTATRLSRQQFRHRPLAAAALGRRRAARAAGRKPAAVLAAAAEHPQGSAGAELVDACAAATPDQRFIHLNGNRQKEGDDLGADVRLTGDPRRRCGARNSPDSASWCRAAVPDDQRGKPITRRSGLAA